MYEDYLQNLFIKNLHIDSVNKDICYFYTPTAKLYEYIDERKNKIVKHFNFGVKIIDGRLF